MTPPRSLSRDLAVAVSSCTSTRAVILGDAAYPDAAEPFRVEPVTVEIAADLPVPGHVIDQGGGSVDHDRTVLTDRYPVTAHVDASGAQPFATEGACRL